MPAGNNTCYCLPEGWHILSSAYLHRKPWLTVRCDKLQMPDGHIIPEYFVLEYPDWINVIALTKDGNFVLVRQYRHGLGAMHYELCAGVAEAGEQPLAAAKRELMEETGYGGGEWQEWMISSANPATGNNLVYCFIAKDVEQLAAPMQDASEDIETHIVSYDTLRAMMENGQIVQATHLAALWRYMAALG